MSMWSLLAQLRGHTSLTVLRWLHLLTGAREVWNFREESGKLQLLLVLLNHGCSRGRVGQSFVFERANSRSNSMIVTQRIRL